jgi:hypothetical protein
LLVEKKGVVPVELRFGGHVAVSGIGGKKKPRGNGPILAMQGAGRKR